MNAPHGLSAVESAALTRRVTLYSVATAAVLVAIKLAAWLASGSIALLASTADSGLDLLASLTTFFAVRYAVAPPDAEHRYGHGKAEGFASLVQAGLVFASAALIAREAIGDLMTPKPIQDGGWAVAVMAVSLLLTALLIVAQGRVLKKTSSVAVSGDRAHYAADLASNLIALVGIAATAWLGIARLDAVAALVIAALLLWGAVGVFREASGQLMDHELPDEVRARIVELMTEDRRLTDVHQLRTRASGPYVHMQMHVDLDPELTLEAAHQVIVAAENRVLNAFPAADIIIHADPRGRAEPHGGAFAETKPRASET
ncbi:MAG TPA: cation diffusion facilitator family transporter [Phenylobacterium sp.]|nr:cation diffusion facilitator family transporter [Phenylobacterium sp.]